MNSKGFSRVALAICIFLIVAITICIMVIYYYLNQEIEINEAEITKATNYLGINFAEIHRDGRCYAYWNGKRFDVIKKFYEIKKGV